MANVLITQLNNPVVLQQLNQRLAAIASLLMIVACAYLLVEITWMFFPQDEAAQVLEKNRTEPAFKDQAQQNNFKNLTSVNVFGVSETATVVKQTKVPETRLNLSLKGVLASDPMKMASAIISQGKSGKEDIYGIGDKMPGGITVKEIYPDYVVLERNGSLETLRLEQMSDIDGFQSNASDEGVASHNLYSGGSTGSSSPEAALKSIRADILKNPTSFGDYALPVVIRENGKQIGYRLQPQKKGELLSELGIQENDIITQVNGVMLDDQKNAISALRKLSTAKDLSIMVKRDGAEIPLNISLP